LIAWTICLVHSVQADLLSTNFVSSQRLEALNSLPSFTNILFHSSFRTSINATLSLPYQLFSNSSLATLNSYFLLLSSSAAFLAFSHFSISFISSSFLLCSGDSLDNLSHSALFVSFSNLYLLPSLNSLCNCSFLVSQILISGLTLAVCSHIISGFFDLAKFSFNLLAKSDGFSSHL
jgi:hypothetical protein